MFVAGHSENFMKFVIDYTPADEKNTEWYKEYGEKKLMNAELVDVTLKLGTGDLKGKVQIEKIENVFMVPHNIQMDKYWSYVHIY